MKCAEKTVIQELLVKSQGERLFEKPVKNKTLSALLGPKANSHDEKKIGQVKHLGP